VPTGHLDARGVLVSAPYGDVYFADDAGGDPVAAGLAQARCVFLEGNDLPDRFARLGAGTAVVGETGFGSGLTFLATWDAFRRAAPPRANLHYWSVDAHPLPAEVLREVFARAGACGNLLGGALAQAYERSLDLRPRGTHRLVLDGGRVRLTLVIGDALQALRDHTFWADAWYLDGFSPTNNPAMWSPELLRWVGARSRVGTTVGTWCAAGHVRRGLIEAGFEVERIEGFGRKRHRLAGRISTPPPAPRHRVAPWQLRSAAWAGAREATIVGAGIAGCTAARALAERGFAVGVRDPRGTAAGASGVPLAVVQPRLAPPDAFGPAWATAGFCFSAPWLDQRARAWDLGAACGVLHPAWDVATQRELQARLAASGAAPGLATWLDAAAARERCGAPTPSTLRGGVWIPQGRVVPPRALCAQLLDHPSIEARTEPRTEPRTPSRWAPAADSLTVLANAHDATAHDAARWLDLRPVRGQLTGVRDPGDRAPQCVLAGAGHLTPSFDGVRWLGSTYAKGDLDLLPRAEDDDANLERLARLAPFRGDLASGPRSSWAGVRATSPDSVPIVGPLPDPKAFEAQHSAQLRGGRIPAGQHPPLPPVLANLGHGSRGVVTTPLTSELLGDLVDGTPLPVPDSLAHRLWPARFLARQIARSGPSDPAPPNHP